MSASTKAKSAGFKSLVHLIEVAGCYPRRTLEDMSDNYPERFELLILGCQLRQTQESLKNAISKIERIR